MRFLRFAAISSQIEHIRSQRAQMSQYVGRAHLRIDSKQVLNFLRAWACKEVSVTSFRLVGIDQLTDYSTAESCKILVYRSRLPRIAVDKAGYRV